jgi:hypothetical protein
MCAAATLDRSELPSNRLRNCGSQATASFGAQDVKRFSNEVLRSSIGSLKRYPEKPATFESPAGKRGLHLGMSVRGERSPWQPPCLKVYSGK